MNDSYTRITHCRNCGSGELIQVADFGELPLADGLLNANQLDHAEPRFPLTLMFCSHCSLLQLRESVSPEILFCSDYPYYSSYSDTWLGHCRRLAGCLIDTCRLDGRSMVVEIASNDGYMLRNFRGRGIRVLGIDPAEGPAAAAEALGIEVRKEFFSRHLAAKLREEGHAADLVIANNVLAHVPDLDCFVGGIAKLLKPDGMATLEFPYVGDLVNGCEFDTIYHEHLSYFSLHAVRDLFRRRGLAVVHAQRLPTHGGSLRIFVRHEGVPSAQVLRILKDEEQSGMLEVAFFEQFMRRVVELQSRLKFLLAALTRQGKRIAAYGAAAKGVSLLNMIGASPDWIDYVVDRNVHKQGKWIPGLRRPIYETGKLLDSPVDYALLLAWNYRDEILKQQAEFRRHGGKFIIPIPDCELI